MSGIGGQIPNFPGPVKVGTAPNQLTISNNGVVTMAGTAKRILTLRAEMDHAAQIAQAKPTQINLGAFKGYSFPIFNADDEQLWFRETVPSRWDGASDIIFHVKVVLANTEDVGDVFKFQLSWEHAVAGEPVPVTLNDVEVQQAVLTDRNAQYDEYSLIFTIDHDIDGAGNEIKAHELLAARLRRIAATGTAVDNEIIVLNWHTHYVVDKMFGNS